MYACSGSVSYQLLLRGFSRYWSLLKESYLYRMHNLTQWFQYYSVLKYCAHNVFCDKVSELGFKVIGARRHFDQNLFFSGLFTSVQLFLSKTCFSDDVHSSGGGSLPEESICCNICMYHLPGINFVAIDYTILYLFLNLISQVVFLYGS